MPHCGIIPALAGNTLRARRSNCIRGDHPRSRGEYTPGVWPEVLAKGSSPLSRGIRMPARQRPGPGRIIPALAGNTPRDAGPDTVPEDHPRSRGEYHVVATRQGEITGSSPLSRGIRCPAIEADDVDRIIPALAGNTYHTMTYGSRQTDHPRSRGEYPCQCDLVRVTTGSSPLSRGIHGAPFTQGTGVGIIPALAGNTHDHRYRNHHCSDHPRSRGEYQSRTGCTDPSTGSSPLSRGIPRLPG